MSDVCVHMCVRSPPTLSGRGEDNDLETLEAIHVISVAWVVIKDAEQEPQSVCVCSISVSQISIRKIKNQ